MSSGAASPRANQVLPAALTGSPLGITTSVSPQPSSWPSTSATFGQPSPSSPRTPATATATIPSSPAFLGEGAAPQAVLPASVVVTMPAAQRADLGSTSQAQHETDTGAPRENFIPFRFPDLRDQILQDYAKVFDSPEMVAKFNKLCRWLSARNAMRLWLAYGDVQDKYAYVDPDNDSEKPGAGSGNGDDTQARIQDFILDFLSVLDKGEFDEVPEEQLVAAGKSLGLRGVHVQPCDPNLVRYKFWFRGIRKKKVAHSSWKRCWREREVEIVTFQRVALQFSSPPEAEVAAYLEAQAMKSRCTRLWRFLTFCLPRRSIQLTSEESLAPGLVYLKLFKDVELADLDMLLPGAKARFTWFDQIMIWGPILFGVGAAIYKALSDSISFDGLVQIVLSLVLIVMPLTWGLRAYLAVKDKMEQYRAYLNELMLTHNLDNNAGVVTGVLAEAQEQEDNEAMLAYFFLWRGEQVPTPLSKQELDAAVEKYLQGLIVKQALDVRLDFEVHDSIQKLEAMGLLTKTRNDAGEELFQVLPLDEAVQQVHISRFDEQREVVGARTMGRLTTAARAAADQPTGPADPVWRECVGTYPPTGQEFRYFYNTVTHESTYTVPDRYVPLSPHLLKAHTLAGHKGGGAGQDSGPSTPSAAALIGVGNPQQQGALRHRLSVQATATDSPVRPP